MRKLKTAWRLNSTYSIDVGEKFDEVVVGDWLHVEMMDYNHAFAVLGGRRFDVYVEKGEVVVKEQEQ